MGETELIALATAIVAVEAGAIAKLWHALGSERAKNTELTERLNKDHKRDLKWQLGIPTSMDPGPFTPAPTPKIVIRAEPTGPPRPKKLRK